jgi:hypothetical protein
VKCYLAEKGGQMEYVTPEVEVMGAGSELVQAFLGPHSDFGANALSLGAMCNNLEED